MLWAEDFTDRSIDLYFWKGEIPASWFLALNPLMIFLFTPLLVWLWARQARAAPSRSCISKMAFACFCVAVAYLVMAAAAAIAGGGKASPLWLVGYFVLVTHRRALSFADRLVADVEERARAPAIDDDGHVVRDDLPGRYPREVTSAASGAAWRKRIFF